MTLPDLEPAALAKWLEGEAEHQERIAARYKAASTSRQTYARRAEVFRASAAALAARSTAPEAGKAVAWLPDPIGVNEIWQTVYDSLDLSEELRTECANEVAATIAKTFSSPLPRVRVAARAAYLLTKCADIFDANDFGADIRFEARQVAEGLRNPADKEWLETFSNVVEGRLEDELAAALGVVSTELAPYSWDELLEIVRERLASVPALSGAEPAWGPAVRAATRESHASIYAIGAPQAVPAEDVAGDAYELANQLFGYSDESTPDYLAEYLEDKGRLATALADRLTASEAEATSLRRKLEEHRKALEPFAAVAKTLPDPRLINDEAPGVMDAHMPAFKKAVGKLTLGDFRRVFWLMEARALSGASE